MMTELKRSLLVFGHDLDKALGQSDTRAYLEDKNLDIAVRQLLNLSYRLFTIIKDE